MKSSQLHHLKQSILQEQTRRHFIKGSFLGLGGLAMGAILNGCKIKNDGAGESGSNAFELKPPHFNPRAKSVIYLHMAGAPSQLELCLLYTSNQQGKKYKPYGSLFVFH